MSRVVMTARYLRDLKKLGGCSHWIRCSSIRESIRTKADVTEPETKRNKRLALATEVAGFKAQIENTGAVSTPIYQTATFDISEQNVFDYTRSGNPTRHALEELCARIEHAQRAFAFTSGMAALSAVLRLLSPGDVVIASRDIYGGMHRVLKHAAIHSGLEVHFVETWNLNQVEEVLSKLPKARMMCLESPTNPMMRVSDLRALSDLCKLNGMLLSVDNSIMSPVLSTPLDVGADIVVHSGTKFLSGHSDVMAGIVAVKDEEIARRIAFIQNAEGSGLAPFDCWLVLRGMKTLSIRVQAAQRNAIEMADLLSHHPIVTKVHYIAPSHVYVDGKQGIEAKLHYSQARGGGCVISFETGHVEISKAFIEHACGRGGLFKQTVSFGSVSSLVEMPFVMSHASIPEDERLGIPKDLIRVSVGIEDQGDLYRSMSEALAMAQTSCERGLEMFLPEHSGVSRKVPAELNVGSGALPFGVSLPPRDEHAVGVSMPSWEDVIAYEEGSASHHERLQAGYPRFVYLNPVKELHAAAEKLFAKQGESAMAAPSARAALRLQKFLLAQNCKDVNVHDFYAHGVFAVTFPAQHSPSAKLYWQHCGEIVSSRLAQAVVNIVNRTCWENAARVEKEDSTFEMSTSNIDSEEEDWVDFGDDNTDYHRRTSARPLDALRLRVASLAGEDIGNTFVYPTGMAGIAAVHRLLKLSSEWVETPLRNVVFGFPYLDTLKLNARPELGGGVIFFGNADQDDLDQLETILREGERIGGLFCEFPSNPLLRAPPLHELRRLADEYKFPIIVDDSISGFCNVDVLRPGGADILVSSLTKQFSGGNNVMGGSVVLNSHGSMFSQLRARLSRDFEPMLWKEDAAVLLSSSADVEARANVANKNAQAVVDFLLEDPRVKHVYHPSVESKELYEEWMREGGGYGALFSVLLHSDEAAREFYDRLDVAKGPGFGCNFTLSCPYTMIAHFNELEWCKTYGVDPSLVRVWVGLEDSTKLLDSFHNALEGPVCKSSVQ
eukprot:m.201486 g.201486  ORF g.201486 m.201486 type:complete len:1006 (+) comp15744_c0_seq10:222-3239(+)